MKIRAVIVEDEPLARRRLKRLLAEHSDVDVAGEADDGEKAVGLILEQRPDLVFLDVRMPGKDGVATLRELHQKLPEGVRPAVVFVTAYEEHAVDAFELGGTDYLVKPIDARQLERALRRVREAVWRKDAAESDGADADETATSAVPRASGHLAGHRAGKIVNLTLEDVACILVDDTITWAHTPQGKYRLKAALQEVEERLPAPPFVRVSRSAIVNLDWIDHLSPMFSGTYVARMRPAIGLDVHVSRRRARQLRELLGW